MQNASKKTTKQAQAIPNPLEAVKEIGHQTATQMREEISSLPKNLVHELLGITQNGSNYSGELNIGDSLEMNEVLSGKMKDNTEAKQQISFERTLLQAEKREQQQKTNELRLELNMIQNELIKIAQSTESLAKETEIAAMQSAIDPGVYHIIFFEKLLEFVKSFRKKINEANVWLTSVNQRTAKKNAWGSNYKKHGAKYLLSGEHYVARSAG